MNNTPTLLVAVDDRAAVVKLTGRANFSMSVSFKRLLSELEQRGFDQLDLDLTECVTMDSTFLGVLAGTVLKNSEAANSHAGRERPRLRLLNPNQRVTDLLDNLGVAELFETVRSERATSSAELAPAAEAKPTREEFSRTCLEAHRVLMKINPENAARFKDVADFLAEDLKKLDAQGEKPGRSSGELQNASTS